jgi:hypothetical protein
MFQPRDFTSSRYESSEQHLLARGSVDNSSTQNTDCIFHERGGRRWRDDVDAQVIFFI